MNLIIDAPQDIQDAMTNILDTFSGADDGVGFVKLCDMINLLSKQPDDPSVEVIFGVILHFSRLINVSKTRK